MMGGLVKRLDFVFESFQQMSRSRNVAARAATRKYLIFIDADTIVSRELIEKTLDLMSSGNVCAGGALAQFINADKQTNKLSKWWNVFAKNKSRLRSLYFLP